MAILSPHVSLSAKFSSHGEEPDFSAHDTHSRNIQGTPVLKIDVCGPFADVADHFQLVCLL